MSWRAISIGVGAGLWAMVASAQTPPRVLPLVNGLRLYSNLRPGTKLMGSKSRSRHVCSVPLTEVPVSNNVRRMPKMRPHKPVEPMPLVSLPAPPCEENKR